MWHARRMRAWWEALVTGPAADRRVMRLARSLAAVILVVSVVRFADRAPHLVWPTDIGTDVSNYRAAGERLAEGHPLYALSAGDRPVPQDLPPYFDVPLLSPPPIAVAWWSIDALPASIAMRAWWLVSGAAALGFALLLIRGLPLFPLLGATLLFPFLAVVALSGNVNGLLLWVGWFAWRSDAFPDRRGAGVAAGFAAAAGGAVKLTPGIFLVWLATRRRRPTVCWGIGLGLGAVLLTILVAGPGSFADYLTISGRTTVSGATALSLTGIARDLGLPAAFAGMLPAIAGLVAAGILLIVGRHPRAGFVVACVASIVASPVVRLESLALLLPAFVPSIPTRSAPLDAPVRAPLPMRAVGFAGIAVVALALALGAVTERASAYRVANGTEREYILRIRDDRNSRASVGWVIPSGASGWAWRDQAGTFQGEATLFADSCVPLETWRTQPLGESLTLGSGSGGGMPSLVREPIPDGLTDDGDERYFAFTHRCTEGPAS